MPRKTTDQVGTEDRGVKSAERALDMLELLAGTTGPMTLSQVALALEMPKSSAHGLLKTLERRGYARFEQGHYSLGPQTARIARAYPAGLELTRAANDVLERLNAQTHETVQLASLEGTEAHFLALKESSHAFRLVAAVGKRLPAHLTGVGKAMLATLSDAEVRALYKGSRLETLTPQSLSSLKALLEDLGLTRRRGYAFDDQESNLGVQCVACPVRDRSGAVVAAVSVSAPSVRMNRKRFVALVTDAAKEISARIGYKPGR